jgi:hypothetical protein
MSKEQLIEMLEAMLRRGVADDMVRLSTMRLLAELNCWIIPVIYIPKRFKGIRYEVGTGDLPYRRQ